MALNLDTRHLEENLDEWLTEELDNFSDDDYLVFDCPEDSMNTHTHDVVWNLCLASFYLITIHKPAHLATIFYFYLNPESHVLLSELNQRMAPQFEKLNKALIELVYQYSLVSFVPLDLRKESSIQYVLSQIDNCIQYGEDTDVKVKDFDPEDDD
ncbi:hypothetical protein CsSME_00031946 [Camellia sinensis var. sinensis]